MVKKPKTDKLKTIEMEVALANYFNVRQNIIVPNVSWGLGIHECDLLIVRASGYLIEVEIKISKADLIKDSKKEHKHIDKRIKELYFALPDYLENCIEYIPERAGILLVSKGKNGYYVKIIRNAFKNNTNPIQYQLKKLHILHI